MSSSDWSITAFTNLNDLYSLESVWKDLQNPVTSFNLGTSYEYVVSGCETFGGHVAKKHFGDKRALLVLLLKHRGKPVALAPFVKLTRRRKLGPVVKDIDYIEWIGQWWGLDQFRSVVGMNTPETAKLFLDWLYANEKFDILGLMHMKSNDPLVGGYREGLMKNEPFPIVTVSKESYAQHVDIRYSKRIRQLIRTAKNHGRRNCDDLSTEFQHYLDVEEEVMRLARARIVSGKGTQFENNDFSDFIRNLSRCTKLEVLFLKLAGKNVAFRLLLALNDSFHCLDYSYDREYKKLQPGALLIDRSIREAYERGFRTVAPGFGRYLNTLRFADSLLCGYKFLRPGNTAISPIVYKLVTNKHQESNRFFAEEWPKYWTPSQLEYNEFEETLSKV